ncbi:nucleotidyl transferase AbiEii/AbiGii toxin family protein [Ezakiella peruensis]|uniref:nucleotidyl transferase AbiEii/AbiGii toxin family protein n=1 Tax=Ezakiella peruensis TaxID=1464038 RepID=UPI000C1B4CC0|nr:nucleotidyl transferase AbiEii/AbiGii toxin family protein [Ezakiella peruensis]
MINIESIKGKIRYLSKNKKLSSQEVLQMYFFERFLDRLSRSDYQANFVIKGGFLISSLIGVENRTTMDLDATVKGIPLKEDKIREIIEKIIDIEVGDGIDFEICNLEYIREDDDYENFRVSLIAKVGKTRNPIKLDITTGDVITPREIDYHYPCIFNEGKIKVLAYPLETILAEKYESIIKRNISNTRMRDFYDIYTLYNLKKDEIDTDALKAAIERTAVKRESIDILKDSEEIIGEIREDTYLLNLWDVYIRENEYIGNLSFNDAVDAVYDIYKIINKDE